MIEDRKAFLNNNKANSKDVEVVGFDPQKLEAQYYSQAAPIKEDLMKDLKK